MCERVKQCFSTFEIVVRKFLLQKLAAHHIVKKETEMMEIWLYFFEILKFGGTLVRHATPVEKH
jgi:hypothetical protein